MLLQKLINLYIYLFILRLLILIIMLFMLVTSCEFHHWTEKLFYIACGSIEAPNIPKRDYLQLYD